MVKLNINCSLKTFTFGEKKRLLQNGSIIISFFQNLIFRLTGVILDGFGLALNSSPSVTMSVVYKGVISK